MGSSSDDFDVIVLGAGVVGINTVAVTPDGRAYAYSFARLLSDLYVVSGLR